MSYQSDRDLFVGTLAAEFSGGKNGVLPHDSVALARLILRNAATIEQHAVDLCNREVSGDEVAANLPAANRIRAACEPWGITPRFSGDPRGSVVKLLLPSGRWNSADGKKDGFCVPTR